MDLLSPEYKQWLNELKGRIRSSQLKAAIAVNSVLIQFYWELGKSISEKQTEWGSQFIPSLSRDLQSEFPEMKGFSLTNLKYCRQFYQYFPKSPQLGDELSSTMVIFIPWGHIKLIINKIANKTEARFYIQQTIENNWSRDVLDGQIRSRLYQRKGNSITNFKNTLPQPLSDLADQTLKDPYIFDFLTLDTNYRERDMKKPMGISEITFVHNLPDDLKSSLPTINELESELKGLD